MTKTRIVKFPSFIFLCGGKISEDDNVFFSCRDLFYSYINKNGCSFKDNVVLAEQVFEYFDHSDYSSLLLFEKDLAELSILTILFSESPGSIAELGSFAVLENIQRRLLVVMHQDDTHQESFIWRGPISYLKDLAEKNGNDDPITIYNWQREKNENGEITNDNFSDAVDLSETIENLIKKRPKTFKFSEKQLGHIMLLIISSLKIVQLATLKEIVFILKTFGIDTNPTTVKRSLSLLKSLKLVVLKPYRNYEFYMVPPQNDWFRWGYKKEAGKNRDSIRWSSEFAEFYRKHQPEKARAIRSYLATQKIGS